jgi:septal ring factor EnvC (AmiA/AmiB activator)
MKKSTTRKLDFEKIWQIGSLILAFASLVFAIYSLAFDTKSFTGIFPNGGMDSNTASKAQVESINAEITDIKQEQENLNHKIDTLSQVTNETVLSSQLADVKNSVESIDTRLSSIENLIIQNPQKALEIPLLRKDLDNLTTTNEIQMTALRQDVERSYNFSKSQIAVNGEFG